MSLFYYYYLFKFENFHFHFLNTERELLLYVYVVCIYVPFICLTFLLFLLFNVYTCMRTFSYFECYASNLIHCVVYFAQNFSSNLAWRLNFLPIFYCLFFYKFINPHFQLMRSFCLASDRVNASPMNINC